MTTSLKSRPKLGKQKTGEGAATCYGVANHNKSQPTSPNANGRAIVIPKQVADDTLQITIVQKDRHEASVAGLAYAREMKRKLGISTGNTPAKAMQAKSSLNKFCRLHDLKFFYTLTCSSPVTSLSDFDAMLHRFTASLTRAGIDRWAATRERHESGGWHAHVAVGQMYNLRQFLKLWRAAAGEYAGYVCRPDPKKSHSYSPGKASRYMSKSFDKLPVQGGGKIRWSFRSKPIKRREQLPRSLVPLEVGGNLEVMRNLWASRPQSRLVAFHVCADGRVTFELCERGKDNTHALAQYVKANRKQDRSRKRREALQ